uniref:Uncharacterized protein n=1 Tax=Oryza glaberrima TaxID=4538 RepID=I1PQ38_ORYGL
QGRSCNSWVWWGSTGRRRPSSAPTARIAAAFVLPLFLLFLVHIAISHALFSHIDSDDSAFDSAAPCTHAQCRLLHRLANDWFALLLFKAANLFAILFKAENATRRRVPSGLHLNRIPFLFWIHNEISRAGEELAGAPLPPPPMPCSPAPMSSPAAGPPLPPRPIGLLPTWWSVCPEPKREE